MKSRAVWEEQNDSFEVLISEILVHDLPESSLRETIRLRTILSSVESESIA
jgi:hypothetical protein